MTAQEIGDLLLKFIATLQPIILAGLVTWQVVNTNKLATVKKDLATAQAIVETQGKRITDYAVQQQTNVQHIKDLEDLRQGDTDKLNRTNAENKRLSEALEKAERERKAELDNLSQRLQQLQSEYDGFKTKTAEEKQADRQLILGLQAEVEKAYADATRWHEQSDKYEADFQQQNEAFTRLEEKYDNMAEELRKLKTKTDELTPTPPAQIE